MQRFRDNSKKGGFDIEGMSDAEVLLEPKAWIANGKVEGWNNCAHDTKETCDKCTPQWMDKMHEMIDHLAQGKDIESYISSLFE